MRVDLLAGTVYAPVTMPPRAPTILVFDSGLGGLTVFAEICQGAAGRPLRLCGRRCRLPLRALCARRISPSASPPVMERLIARHGPDLVVVACNTASTSTSSCRTCARISTSRSSAPCRPSSRPPPCRARGGSACSPPPARSRGTTRDPDRRACRRVPGDPGRLAAPRRARRRRALRRAGRDADVLAEIAPGFRRGRSGPHGRRGARPAPITRCCCRASSASRPGR